MENPQNANREKSSFSSNIKSGFMQNKKKHFSLDCERECDTQEAARKKQFNDS